ncbi:MAG TPA: 23S rRNA (adenine(2503)-C(2))-methyltransferase RlmN [Candidatus Binatia bacterium]|jgi:23S rRNA (adenine2503-C2)-methyltransferase
MAQRSIKDLSREELEKWLAARREPKYRAGQILRWLYRKSAASFAEMSDLSANLRQALEEAFTVSRLRTARKDASADGTVKFLFRLGDGASIESVLIPEAKRLTLCISTQAGCGLGCAFCATALLGLKRNLRASEIVDQVLEAARTLDHGVRITHLVLMGMGEPLANYQQTLNAVRIMTDADWGLAFSSRRVTLSTVGLVPQIKKLMDETHVNLAVSLHATTNDLRSELMPVNRKYPLDQLIDCCRALPIPKRRRITFEYVVLRGVNHSTEDARRLAQLLRGIRSKINLIPFNPHPGSPFQRPTPEEIDKFQNELRACGYQVNVRTPRGDDIAAACGQLQAVSSEQWRDRQTSHSSLLTSH